ncbi:MAG: anthranilate phosphoribosyltransferase [Deltaproteobacteria bacterium]|nr:MAG: anthranilate phosphoribosyltransferase [Deltaproteobacteria bacterium]
MIRESVGRVVAGKNLSQAEMEQTMEKIMDGEATPAQIGAFITALRMKGETVDEITGAARVMRAKAIKIPLKKALTHRDGGNSCSEAILDTCGTGGDGVGTFNVSTATAFVVAGGGVVVAKHGNRAVSSRCGSADVLEALGVKLDIAETDVARCIGKIGIGFLYAPVFHEAMKHAAGPRREIGIRTIFNILGPLTNPAGATAQVLGVYDPDLTEKMAHVLGRLGTTEAFVVCGDGSLDEISITGPTRLSHLKNGNVRTFDITPEQFGFTRARTDAIKGGNVKQNAGILKKILEGETGPKRDMVLLNAGAAFVAAGKAPDIKGGIEQARESLDSGKARQRLNDLVLFTQSCGTVAR